MRGMGRGERARPFRRRRLLGVALASLMGMLLLWECLSVRRSHGWGDSAAVLHEDTHVSALSLQSSVSEMQVELGQEAAAMADKDGRAALLQSMQEAWLSESNANARLHQARWLEEGAADEKEWTEPIPHMQSFVQGIDYDRKHVTCHVPGSLNRCLPSVIIAGFAKCGTAQLLSDLGHCHPQIVAAPGEPKGLFRKQSDYLKLLPKVLPEDQQLLMESSPAYALSTEAELRKAMRLLPGLKVILLLRDPLERQYSHFRMALRNHELSSPFLASFGVTNCGADTSECFLGILTGVILKHEEWRTCYERKGRIVPSIMDRMSERDYLALVECIHDEPHSHWNKDEIPFFIDSFAGAIRAFQSVFGENLLLLLSEEFYDLQAHPRFLPTLMHFLGLDELSTMAQCFLAIGNEKIRANVQSEVSQDIHVTSLSPIARELLAALHFQDRREIEDLLGRSLPWTW